MFGDIFSQTQSVLVRSIVLEMAQEVFSAHPENYTLCRDVPLLTRLLDLLPVLPNQVHYGFGAVHRLSSIAKLQFVCFCADDSSRLPLPSY